MAEIIPHDVSKHTILGKIKNSYDYFLMNLLAGSADIIDEQTAIKFRQGVYPQKADFIRKGYLINQEDEKLLFINSYCDTCEKEEKKGILIHFVPWFSCNLSCDFCPFKELKKRNDIASENIVQSFFSYLDSYFAKRKKIIALTGGEPLLPGESYKKTIMLIFSEAGSRRIPIRINTNGYYLQSYIPVLKEKDIEAIHIYLDFRNTPYENDHTNQDKQDYFEQVAGGIRASLENGYNTHIKILIDRKEIKTLHLLAACAEQSGWTDNPLFSADVISRENFLLCNSMHSLFPSPAEVVEDIYNHILKYPEILELYRPPLSVTRSLFELNHLPPPLFKACPGGMSELVCTPEGNIFPCTASIVKNDECLGLFHPEVTIHRRTASAWEDRDISTIKECIDCPYQFACGAGCTIKARETSGKYLSPNCIPVKPFMEMGLSLYFDKKLVSGE